MAEFNKDESEVMIQELNTDSKKAEDIYDKLRAKVNTFTADKFRGKYGKLIDYLLLLPDFVVLLIRLACDKRVSGTQKIMVGGIILYVISPIDIIPDFIPVIGLADDLLLVVYGLNTIVNEIDKEIVEEHWSGNDDLLQTLRNAADIAEKFLSKNVIKKISAFFSAVKGKQ
ncbi:MAG: DUF1232 domain-containing protein [Candidatus Cloacimonetes bacterium]|nr:DUF1232 domain-containing protein [Candidatus Cloacimonadota bacterium]